jgi:hypothetical protein
MSPRPAPEAGQLFISTISRAPSRKGVKIVNHCGIHSASKGAKKGELYVCTDCTLALNRDHHHHHHRTLMRKDPHVDEDGGGNDSADSGVDEDEPGSEVYMIVIQKFRKVMRCYDVGRHRR